MRRPLVGPPRFGLFVPAKPWIARIAGLGQRSSPSALRATKAASRTGGSPRCTRRRGVSPFFERAARGFATDLGHARARASRRKVSRAELSRAGRTGPAAGAVLRRRRPAGKAAAPGPDAPALPRGPRPRLGAARVPRGPPRCPMRPRSLCPPRPRLRPRVALEPDASALDLPHGWMLTPAAALGVRVRACRSGAVRRHTDGRDMRSSSGLILTVETIL